MGKEPIQPLEEEGRQGKAPGSLGRKPWHAPRFLVTLLRETDHGGPLSTDTVGSPLS